MPVSTPAAQPDLVVAPDGALLLSWLEPQSSGHVFKLATYRNGAWGEVREIAHGDDWVANWADTPHLAVTPDGAVWAHWLRKSGQGGYDVVLVRSGDAGTTWSAPITVNDDATPTEHGFVSLWPASRDRLGIAWLDGRNSGGEDGHASHHGQAAMTLRTATFDAALDRFDERELDAMTCDCCQTDAALTSRGPLLAYRDRTVDERTAEEIRDVVTVRFDGKQWSPARPVHEDHWKMSACPVNGPAVAARGDAVLVAWYTAAADMPTVRLARSPDGGERFEAPLMLDSGPQVQGRADVAMDAHNAWVLWSREEQGVQSLQMARFTSDLKQKIQGGEVARLQGRGRATGFARMAIAEGAAYMVWTDVLDGKPELHGARYGASP
jgi:hypothetical protein